MSKNRCLIVYLFFLALLRVDAQENSLLFRNFDTQDGLCDNHINSITEDSRGMIWIATREGLSRYDGAQFKNFYTSKKKSNALRGNFTSCLFNINKDSILFLNNSKLALLRTSNNQIIHLKAFQRNTIANIAKLTDKLYALIEAQKIVIVNHKLAIVHTIKTQSRNYPFQIGYLDNNHFLLCDNENKLFYTYDTRSKQTTSIGFGFKKPSNFQDGYYIIQKTDSSNKRIYISDFWTGLYVFDFKGKLLNYYSNIHKTNPINSNNITSLLLAQDNKIWVTTDNGLSIIYPDHNKTQKIYHTENEKYSLKSNTAIVSFEDRNKNIWIGTNQGISVYKNQNNSLLEKYVIFDGSLPNEFIIDLAFNHNEVYTGTYLSHTYKVNTETHEVKKLNSTPGAWSVQNYNGTINIVGGSKSVTQYNPKTNKYHQLDFLKAYFKKTDIIVMSYRHSNGDIWYSGNAGGGFVRVNAETNQIKHYTSSVNGKRIFSSSYYPYVCEDKKGDLWFGVNKASSLLHWNLEKDTFDEVNFSTLSDENNTVGGINHLICDDSNNLWIAYEGSGLVKYNITTKAVAHFTIENGLYSNYVNYLQFDNQNRLWMLTPKGIFCFVLKNNKMLQLNVWDGFTDNPIHYSVLKMNKSKNQMWLGAQNYLYSFNPDEIIKNKTLKGAIYLDNIKINNSEVIQPFTTSLKPDENNVSFELVAVDIENGKNIEYSYKLSGFDQNWVFTGSSRTAIFPKLSSGHYTFNARAKYKGSNEWFYLKQPFAFSIQTYWYQTWTFIGICIIAFVVLVWYIIRTYLNRKLEKQQALLEKQKAVEDERTRIAADMHDDLGSGLTKITYLSQMALQKEDNATLLSNIKNTSTELVESMSEIIWAMKEENNSWEELLSYIKLYAQEYCQNNQLNVDFQYPEESMDFEIIGEVRRNIFLSIKECLHNIVKHAQAKNVVITIHKNKTIDITIKDDGIGISINKEKQFGGNGLKNICKRMEKINAQFTVINDNGASMQFKIPY